MTEPLAVSGMRAPVRLALCAAVAAAACMVGFMFADASMKRQVIILAGLAGAVLVVALPFRTGLVLMGWVMLLTYNRQYYSFDGIYGDYDSQGLYWIPADMALAALAGLHALDVWRNRSPLDFSRRYLLALAPFILVSALAVLTAVHSSWAFAEWLRWVKLAVAVVVLQRVLRGPNWWFALAGLGIAISLQSLLGATQVIMNTNTGLLSMFTGGGGDQAVAAGVTEGGRARASGTMVHPNILGPFLLYVLPIFLALMVSATHWVARVGALLVCACGYAGLIGTMSRLPIAIGIVQAAAVLACLVVMRGVSIKRLAGVMSFVGIAVVLASAYFVEEISQRISGDLHESISFRAEYNDVALKIWRENPLLGIGLNNFVEGLDHSDPTLSQIVDEMQEGRKEYSIRAAAPVHNLYLLVLAETGLLGLAAFLALLIIALSVAWKSALTANGTAQLVCLGIAVGFAGQYLQQTMDFSLWMDPGLFGFALLFVMAGQPPASGEPWGAVTPPARTQSAHARESAQARGANLDGEAMA